MIVVVAAVMAFLLYSHFTRSESVVRFSIYESVIKEGENTTLTVFVRNFDLKTHLVEYRFRVNHRVSIYEGAEALLPRIGSEYVFNFTLEATDPSKTKIFVVIGSLEKDVSSATYPIALTVYFDEEDLDQTWNDLPLKVED
ncbi:MAG: hypothetical protein GWN86_20130 [Desulfobacterales bacterium]|nr:hypothetical protein [Desulfobacterales bacterium]